VNRIEVVANAMSGTARRLGRDALERLVTERLGSRLAGLQIVPPAGITAALDQAFAGDADAVAVIGGDGTCRAAAERARNARGTVIFLPGGTMNLLPKRIWGESDLDAALTALGRGDVQPVALDVAELDGRLFLVAAMFGAASELTRVREAWRRTRSLGDAGRAGAEAVRTLGVLARPTVRIVEPAHVTARLPALLVTPGDATAALAPAPDTPATPALDCVGAAVRGVPGLIVIAARVLFGGDWRKDKRLVAFRSQRLVVAGRGRRLRATLDGEIVHVANPATLTFLPGGLATCGPRQPAAGEPKLEAAV
jgi:diacylglycerol kinase family enzyme